MKTENVGKYGSIGCIYGHKIVKLDIINKYSSSLIFSLISIQ